MKKIKLTALAGMLLLAMQASATTDTAVQSTNFDKSVLPIPITTIEKKLESKAPNLNPKVLYLALKAYNKARQQGYDKKSILTVIDYSKPSYQKTLWVFDINNDKLLYNTYVAHGKKSGLTTASYFSNANGSDATSLGLYLTGKTFYGSDGLSLRLHGLSNTFNDNAYNRDVVMHGAWYVSQKFIQKYHRTGRSWGCPAVSKKLIAPIANTIKNGTLIFAYGDDNYWLTHGPYVS